MSTVDCVCLCYYYSNWFCEGLLTVCVCVHLFVVTTVYWFSFSHVCDLGLSGMQCFFGFTMYNLCCAGHCMCITVLYCMYCTVLMVRILW